ncbi:hypothetical protein Tco_0510871 [Tanacetum coccineum]
MASIGTSFLDHGIIRPESGWENSDCCLDEFDKETGSSDGLQPKQADLSCVHALNELHLHEIHVVPTGKEVDIGLDGGRDKPLRPADMLLYSWGEGLDVCVDLTGSSPLTQTGMIDFIPGRAVIDVAQRKRGKYMAKCAAIGYGFLPFLSLLWGN